MELNQSQLELMSLENFEYTKVSEIDPRNVDGILILALKDIFREIERVFKINSIIIYFNLIKNNFFF